MLTRHVISTLIVEGSEDKVQEFIDQNSVTREGTVIEPLLFSLSVPEDEHQSMTGKWRMDHWGSSEEPLCFYYEPSTEAEEALVNNRDEWKKNIILKTLREGVEEGTSVAELIKSVETVDDYWTLYNGVSRSITIGTWPTEPFRWLEAVQQRYPELKFHLKNEKGLPVLEDMNLRGFVNK